MAVGVVAFGAGRVLVDGVVVVQVAAEHGVGGDVAVGAEVGGQDADVVAHGVREEIVAGGIGGESVVTRDGLLVVEGDRGVLEAEHDRYPALDAVGEVVGDRTARQGEPRGWFFTFDDQAATAVAGQDIAQDREFAGVPPAVHNQPSIAVAREHVAVDRPVTTVKKDDPSRSIVVLARVVVQIEESRAAFEAVSLV